MKGRSREDRRIAAASYSERLLKLIYIMSSDRSTSSKENGSRRPSEDDDSSDFSDRNRAL